MALLVPSLHPVRTSLRLIASIALVASFAPEVASAQAPSRWRGVIHQQYIALLNPIGMEHALRVGVRSPLGDQTELLFGGAHAETGLVSYVSPVYVIHGAYLQVSPLSFLVLRAELTGHVVWPIGMQGSGYYALQGYDDASSEVLGPERGATATGWSMRLSATLQGMVPIASDVRILVADELTTQRGALGDGSHYYDMKWDLVLARQDWVCVNSAVVMLEIDVDPTRLLRAGLYDDLRFVPASGYLGHQVGPLVTFTFREPAPEVPALTIFVRAGVFTHHVLRSDVTVLGGVNVDYDLGAIR